MKPVRTHAFAAPDVGVWLWPHELQALAGLPAWFVALFVHLVARSNFKSGAGSTGYGELVNALTPDQAERGGPRLWAPSSATVKRAIRRLEDLRILAVDKTRSDQLQRIEFLLAPRSRRGVPAGKRDPSYDPPSHEGKPASPDPQLRPPLSAGNTYPLPPVDNKLSTGGEARERLKALADKMRAGGKTGAPKGA